MQTNKIEVSERGHKTIYIPLSVYRAGKNSLTISFPGKYQGDPESFRLGTSPDQLQKFKEKLEELFKKYIEN